MADQTFRASFATTQPRKSLVFDRDLIPNLLLPRTQTQTQTRSLFSKRTESDTTEEKFKSQQRNFIVSKIDDDLPRCPGGHGPLQGLRKAVKGKGSVEKDCELPLLRQSHELGQILSVSSDNHVVESAGAPSGGEIKVGDGDERAAPL